MDEPLISIVLPTYNGSRYLDEAIQSCLDQTYGNWELIIVDDASTDSTPDIVARAVARDPRIRSYRHPENRRACGALNTGFSHARGSYFTWTSDDNCYRPSALREMVDFLESHSNVDLVYTDYMRMDENGTPVKLEKVAPVETIAVNCCIGVCFLFKRAVHESLGGYAEDLPLAEDYDFWLRVSARFRMEPLHKDLYLYRQHSSQLSTTAPDRLISVSDEIVERNIPALTWMSRSQKARAHMRIASSAVLYGDIHRVRSHTLVALRLSPLVVLIHGKQAMISTIFGLRLSRLANRLKSFAYRLRDVRRTGHQVGT